MKGYLQRISFRQLAPKMEGLRCYMQNEVIYLAAPIVTQIEAYGTITGRLLFMMAVQMK